MRMKRILSLLLASILAVTASAAAFAVPKIVIGKTGILTRDHEVEGDAVAGGRDFATEQLWHDIHDQIPVLRKAAAPNTVAKGFTVSAKNVTGLKLEGTSNAFLLVPGTGTDIVVEYIGMKDPSLFPVSYEAKDGVLQITADCTPNILHYFSTVPGFLVNVVRVTVPPSLTSAIIDIPYGIVRVEGDFGVMAETVNGIIRVVGETHTKDLMLDCINGTVAVEAKTLAGTYALGTINGDVEVKANEISGALEAKAVNGEVELTADKVGSATLTAVNGDIDAEVGLIQKQLTAKVTNGDMEISLTKKPTNLTLTLGRVHKSSDSSLPTGWKNGYRLGNGVPQLNLSVGNGSLDLEVAGY